jgi:cell division protein FtsB
MAQTAEEKKIAKLEKELARYKKANEDLTEEIRNLQFNVASERSWRMDFQRLMKAAAQEDNLKDYERSYW